MITKTLETTNTPLAANGEYVTAWHREDWAQFITISASADQAGTLFVEFSDDKNTVLHTWRTAISANAPYYTALTKGTLFVRARYVNGATAQTSFRLTIGAYNTLI